MRERHFPAQPAPVLDDAVRAFAELLRPSAAKHDERRGPQ